jgi:hypothetical protein
MDASGQEADLGVELAQAPNLGASDRVVRGDDGEADDCRLELGDLVEKESIIAPLDVLIEDADFMAGLFEDGAQEADAQGVLAVHLLGIERARNSE